MKTLDIQTLPLSGQILIEASAGTGKTYTISHLVLRLILLPQAGLKPEALSVTDLLVVTFTKAATQELRDRIRDILHRAKNYLEAQGEADNNLAGIVDHAKQTASTDVLIDRCYQAILQLDDAPIYTIHGFCQKVLKDFGFSMGLPIDLTLVENNQDILLKITQDFWRDFTYQADSATAVLIRQTLSSPESLLSKLRFVLNADMVDPLSSASLTDKLAAYGKLYDAAKVLWDNEETDIRCLFEGIGGRSYTKRNAPAWFDALAGFFSQPQRRYSDFKHSEKYTQSHIDDKLQDKAPAHDLFSLLESLKAQREKLADYLLSFARGEIIKRLDTFQAEQGIVFFDDLIQHLYQSSEASALCEAIRARYPVALIDEFQDTDQYQYRIFNRLYQASDTCLLMIGDPKQAIYSFRGADIHAYFEARLPIAIENRYTLKTNHRTVPVLVNAINGLFQRQSDPFVLDEFPEFITVDPADHRKDSNTLVVGGESMPLVALPLTNDKDKPLNKDEASEQAAANTASWVKQLLASDAQVNARAVMPKDIAILVRTGTQANTIKSALAQEGINSVFLSKDSVLLTDEARSFSVLLQAVLNPFNNTDIFTALGDGLIAMSASDVRQTQDDAVKFSHVQQCFIDAKALWKKQGFFSCFNALLSGFTISENLLLAPDGERRLTNLQQISDLFHASDVLHLPLEEQWLHYQKQRARAKENDGEQKLRLETEANLVEIVTIHGSKGLEYPIVCCPFLYEVREMKGGIVTLHDDKTHQREVSFSQNAEQMTALKKAALAEDVRLLYVALTRAKCHLNFCWGDVNNIQNSAMYHLLCRRLTPVVSAEDLFSPLAALDIPLISKKDYDASLSYRASKQDPILAALPLHRSLHLTYYARSYSALVKKSSHAYQSLVDDFGIEKDRDQTDEQAVEVVPFEQTIFHFPKGSEAGNFLHQVLEDIEFTDTASTLMPALEAQMPCYGFDEDLWKHVVHEHIERCLAKPLAPLNCRLGDVKNTDLIKEMGFQFWANERQSHDIFALLSTYRQAPVDLSFNPIKEDFKGFIDLIFCHEDKYYVLDYKSNFLGFTTADYQQAAMKEAIESHVYDLQYLVYLAALSCYLKTKIPDFDYDKHIGGVFYLFLRGMNETDDAGIYFQHPEKAMVEKFEGLFVEEAVV